MLWFSVSPLKSIFIQQIFTEATEAGITVHAGNISRTGWDDFKDMRFTEEQFLIKSDHKKWWEWKRFSRGNDQSRFCGFKNIAFVFVQNFFTPTSSF